MTKLKKIPIGDWYINLNADALFAQIVYKIKSPKKGKTFKKIEATKYPYVYRNASKQNMPRFLYYILVRICHCTHRRKHANIHTDKTNIVLYIIYYTFTYTYIDCGRT